MKTTLRELVKNINKSDKRLECNPDFEGLANSLDIYDFYYSEDIRLKAYFIKVWYCTDSWVGIRAYFLDDEFIAISEQKGRKCDERFEFVSVELAKKVRDYIFELKNVEEFSPSIIKILDEEIEDDTYSIEFAEQIIHKSAYLNGEKVKIVKCRWPGRLGSENFHKVEILHNGENKTVDCRNLRFKFNNLD